MAELLIRTVDSTSIDPIQNRLILKRGDVVAVCSDNYSWTQETLSREYYIIIKLPKVDVSKFKDLLSEQTINHIVTRLRSRGVNLDDPQLAELLKTTNTLTEENFNVFYNARFDKPTTVIPVILN